MKIVKVQRGKYTGDDWCMLFGRSCIDNKEYTIVTDHINASELHNYLGDAKDDAELVCTLLNAYFNGQIKLDFKGIKESTL